MTAPYIRPQSTHARIAANREATRRRERIGTLVAVACMVVVSAFLAAGLAGWQLPDLELVLLVVVFGLPLVALAVAGVLMRRDERAAQR